MDQAVVMRIMENAISTVLIVSMPVLMIAMMVGIAIAIFQATTQINEQTMVFVPKIIAVFGGLIIFGAWMIGQITDYIKFLFDNILSYI